jgi:hypothetical protein
MPQLLGGSNPHGSGIRYLTVVHGLLNRNVCYQDITHSNYGVYIDRLVNVLRYLIIN